jgi:hypothetical protein
LFHGSRVGGGGFTSGSWLTCSAIVFSTLNSSSSSSMLSLSFCRKVHSISVSSGRMVGFLDRSSCMNQMKFYSSAALVLLFGWSLELRSIALRCALDHSRPALDCSNRDYTATELEQHGKIENIFFYIK